MSISSIKVNGEEAAPDEPYTADVEQVLVGLYGIPKMEAENELMTIVSQTIMEVVIILPALVCGSGVKVSILSVMQWLYKGFSFPFGGIHNCRSLVALSNLVDMNVYVLIVSKSQIKNWLVIVIIYKNCLARKSVGSIGGNRSLIACAEWGFEFWCGHCGKKLCLNDCAARLKLMWRRVSSFLGGGDNCGCHA